MTRATWRARFMRGEFDAEDITQEMLDREVVAYSSSRGGASHREWLGLRAGEYGLLCESLDAFREHMRRVRVVEREVGK